MQDDKAMNNTGLTPLLEDTLSETQILKLGMAVCESLAPFSRENTAHKGVSFDNIFTDASGEYVLGEPSEDVGDVAFAAPELVRGDAFDARADIFSLGMVLAYLTGEGESGEGGRASDGLRTIIRKACAPDPDKRFADVFEMKNALMNLHASMYFVGVSVSIADEVVENVGDSAAVKPWDDTVVVSIPDEGDGDTVVFTPSEDDRLTGEHTAAIFEENYQAENEEAERDLDDEARRNEVIEASRAVTEAQRIMYENSKKKGSLGIAESDRRRVLTVTLIVAVAAILLLGAIILGSVLLYNSVNRPPSESESVNTVESLTIISSPDDLTFYLGEEIDAYGLMLEAVYMDGSAKTVTGNYKVEPEVAAELGRQTVTVTYNGASVTYQITVLPNQIAALYLEKLPERREFAIGERFDFSGMVIDVLFVDGSHEMIIEGYTCSPTYRADAGEQKVTVSYGEKTLSFFVNVIEAEVDSIELLSEPTKLDYYVGQAFDASGLTILAEYPDGTVGEICSGFSVLPEKFTSDGTQTVTVTYGGKSLSLEVEVSRASLTGIEVRTMPAKLKYNVGDTLSLRGFSMWAYYDSGESQIITSGYTYTPKKLTASGEQYVTVTYLGQSTGINVSVSDKPAVSTLVKVSVATPPSKVVYTVGERFEADGLTLTAHYSNGSTKTLTEGFTCTPTELTEVGKTAVNISYNGCSTSFTVTVSEPPETQPVPVLTGVSVATQPKKIQYLVGESFESAGLTLTAHYSNGSTKTLTGGFTCTPTEFTKSGEVTVSISCEGVVTSITVTVTEPIKDGGACGNKATWSINGETLTISGKGEVDNFSDGGAPWSKYGAQIKTVTVESGITSLGAYALANTSVYTLTLPDTLRRIDKTALYNTTSLTALNLDADNRHFIYKGSSLISRDGTKLYAIAFGRFESKYTVPEGVTTIEAYKLFYNSNISEIVINKDLYSIDPTSFIGAKCLEKFTVNARNVALVASDGVLYTKNLNALVCYPYAKSGSSYTVPEGVTVIREYAFAINTKLSTLNLPSTIIRVDENAFLGATRLTEVTFAGGESAWQSIDVGGGNAVLTDAEITFGQ